MWKSIALTMLLFCVTLFSGNLHADDVAMFTNDISLTERAELCRQLSNLTGINVHSASRVIDEEVESTTDPGESLAQTQLKTAIAAYRKLDFETAVSALVGVWKNCGESRLTPTCRDVLFEAEMLTGAIEMAHKNMEAAELAFLSAHAMIPEKVVDPGVFSPPIVREFGRVCARTETLPYLDLALESKPGGATFTINGRPASPRPKLSPGRYSVTAELLGYDALTRTIDVDLQGNGPPMLQFKLPRLDETISWQILRKVLTNGVAGFEASGVTRLFERFDLQHVYFVEKKETRFVVFIAVPGKASRVELPHLDRIDDIKGANFRNPLFRYLAIPLPAVALPTPPPNSSVLEENDFAEANPVIAHTGESTPQPAEKPSEKLGRSPWFWSALGIAGAIIAGVLITMAAD